VITDLFNTLRQKEDMPNITLNGNHIVCPWGEFTIGFDGTTYTALIIPNWIAASFASAYGITLIHHGALSSSEQVINKMISSILCIDSWYRHCQPEQIIAEAPKLASFVRFVRRRLKEHLGHVRLTTKIPRVGFALMASCEDMSNDELTIIEKLVARVADRWQRKHGTSFALEATVDTDRLDIITLYVTPNWKVQHDELQEILTSIGVSHLRLIQ
jgi:hypothetical protein